MKRLLPNLNSIDLFWRASNYLSVGMLYLKDNPLLRDELQLFHFKNSILGHWGTCPGINAIYAHVSDLSRRTGQRMRLIVGTGHAGPAILSCLFLEGSLEKRYSEFSRNIKGITNLFNAFASTKGLNTEITPQYPGMLYSGGELGAALAFSQGYVMNNPNIFSVCVIGDGELETSITQATWQGFKFLSSINDGKLLPIINANGYKQGSKSLYALKSRREHKFFFKSYGLTPIFVEANHQHIAEAFNTAYILLNKSNTTIQPIIILETPKGWTSPDRFGNINFSGSCNSHKPLLKNPSKDINELEMIKTWLQSYRPDELFDAEGSPIQEVINCLPVAESLLGLSNEIDQNPSIVIKQSPLGLNSSIEEISRELANRIRISNDIIIFCPDELISNKLDNLFKITRLKYGRLDNLIYGSNGQIVEILNEHLCYAWAQGYLMSGHHPVIISYEAFATIFDSMTAQHLKFLKESANINWRPACPSMNIILTSLGWNNSSTHHNPGFVDNLIGRNLKHVRIYMPVTSATTVFFLKEMLDSYNRLNIMVVNKHKLEKIFSILSEINDGNYKSWRVLMSDFTGNPKISIIAIGDCMAEESLYAKDILNLNHPDLFVQVLVIEDLSLIESTEHPDLGAFRSIISDSSSCIWVYNGYPKTIKGILWDFGNQANTVVLGYKDSDNTKAGLDRFFENEVSRFHIANEAIRLLSINK